MCLEQKPLDSYSALLEPRRADETVDLPESIEALVKEARAKQYDMPTLLRLMKSMVRIHRPSLCLFAHFMSRSYKFRLLEIENSLRSIL